MKALIPIAFLLLLLPALSAMAQTSCSTRDIIVVEIDNDKAGVERLKFNGDTIKPPKGFDEFYKRCAKVTVVLATPRVRLSQLQTFPFFLGKIGVPIDEKNFFVFEAEPSKPRARREMTYLNNFTTVPYTNDLEELRKIVASLSKQQEVR